MNRDLTQGEPQRVLWRFVLPMFGSVLFQQLYNIADSLVAGNCIGEHALAAVGNSYEITLIYLAFAFGCNIGCSVITSRHFGAGKTGRMKTAVFTSALCSAAACGVLLLLGLLLGKQMLMLIKTPPEIMEDSLRYLLIYTAGLPFVFFYNLATGVFSALGDSKTPFLFLVASSLANIGMDILFVAVFAMGVAGVAWATFICQGISCLLAVLLVLLRLKKMENDTKPELFSVQAMKDFLRIAVPSTLQQSFVSVGNIAIQGVINGFGAQVMAGYSAGIKLNNLVITSYSTMGNGISNFTSQNLGGNRPDRVPYGFKAGVKLSWIITVPFFLLYFFFGSSLIRVFAPDALPRTLESGSTLLKILSPFYFFICLKLMADGVLRGSGMMGRFMISTFTDLVLRVALAFLFSMTALKETGIWCAWPVGWMVAVGLSLLFYYQAWGKKRIAVQ